MSTIPPLQPPVIAQTPTAPAASSGSSGLGGEFANAIDSVSSSLQEADRLTQQVATGQL